MYKRKSRSSLYLAAAVSLAITSSNATSSLAFSPNKRNHRPKGSILASNHHRCRQKATIFHQSSNNLEESARGGGASSGGGGGTATIPNEIFNLVKSIVGA